MTLALDGSNFAANTGGTQSTITLTTTSANDIIALVAMYNTGAFPSLTAVSSTNTTGWARRIDNNTFTGNDGVALWYGTAAAPLSSETINLTWSFANGYTALVAFGISGAPMTSFTDSNGALPANEAGAGVDCSITTSNANDFLISAYRFASTASPTAGAGWTAIQLNADQFLVQYKIVSATQSALDCNIGTGAGDQNGGVADAIIAATAAAQTFYFNNVF